MQFRCKNVNIFDGKRNTLKQGYDVLVVRNLIKKIAKNTPAFGTYKVDKINSGVKRVQVHRWMEQMNSEKI